MSVGTFVFVRDDRLPTIGQLQAALDQANASIVLEDVGDLRSHTGYLPATHRGHDSGFEWFYGPVADNFGGSPPAGLKDRGHVANFVTHSDMRELLCAMVSAAILAQLADGLVLDEESDGLIDGGQALAQAGTLERHVR